METYILFVIIALVASATSQSDCQTCYQEFCDRIEQQGECYTFEGPVSGTCDCSRSLIKCDNGSLEYLPLFEGTLDCITSFNTSQSDGQLSTLSSGFYIFHNPRFCETACLHKITLQAINFNPLQNGSHDLLKIHIFKRYSVDIPFDQGLIAEQNSFSVSLSLISESEGIVEAIVEDPTACFERGDYLGFTLGDNLTIRSVTGISMLQSFDGIRRFDSSVVITNCNSSRPILDTDFGMGPLASQLPVMTVTFKDLPPIFTSPTVVSTPQPTNQTLITGNSTSQTAASTGEDVTTSPSSVSPVPEESSVNIILIIGILIPVMVIVTGVLISVTVLSWLFIRYKSHSQVKLMENSPDIVALKSTSMASMNSGSGTYHDPIFESPDRVTVINPYAVADEMNAMNPVYQEPFAIPDGANAKSRPRYNGSYPSQGSHVQPANMVDTSSPVINVNYGVPSALFGGGYNEPASPTYQNPDELAGTPQLMNRRGTIQNKLYSTTDDFGVKTTFAGSASNNALEDLQNSIYNEPFELEPNQQQHTDSPFARPRLIPSNKGGLYDSDFESDSARNGSRESLDRSSGQHAFEYSLPVLGGSVKATAANPLAVSKVATAQSERIDQSQPLQLFGEITSDEGNHHYHLLDDNASQDGYTTEDDEELAGSAHHIINQPGACVPNSEDRRELYHGDTLKPASVDAWKKSSFKRGKFFVRQEKFWVPSQNKSTLFDQLNQKRFREIFKDHLQIKSHIGSGQFGSVQKAKLKYPSGETDVAVKIMKPSAIEDASVKFLQEAAIMGQFFHPNIIELFGIVTLNKPLMIVMEYMPLGDLHSYLHKHYRTTGAAPPQPITLLKFCRQIVQGMMYLAGKHFVHRDLAARNVFVSSTLVCKIGDFGMSRNLMDEEYYKSHGGIVPIKWTAPEGLLYKKYSTASDVYSYGMTMFEIWSLGEKPLRDIPIQNVAKTIAEGYCQPPPPGTPSEIYSVMVQCWNPEQSNRVSFEAISEVLMMDDKKLLSWSDSDPEDSSAAKLVGSPLEDGYHLYKDLQNTYNSTSSDITSFRSGVSIEMYKV